MILNVDFALSGIIHILRYTPINYAVIIVQGGGAEYAKTKINSPYITWSLLEIEVVKALSITFLRPQPPYLYVIVIFCLTCPSSLNKRNMRMIP